MNRKKVVRVELFLLAAVTLLLAYRVMQGPPSPEGVVSFSDIDSEEVRHTAFVVEHPVRVVIDAVGSLESTRQEDAELAAYGWILDRRSREVIWKMSAAASTRDRGHIASQRDTVELNPGIYDAWYTSYGNRHSHLSPFTIFDRIFGNGSAWRKDEKHWKMIVQQVGTRTAAVTPLHGEPHEHLVPRPTNQIWTSAPMRGNREREFVLEVAEPARLGVYAVGEIERSQMDFGWIENVLTKERIWEMTLDNTAHAGGWSVNRIVMDTLALEEGIYRAVYKTDPRQNWGDWVGNPPYDPAAWGMTLSADPLEAVSPFSPFATRDPLIEMTRVRNDERRTTQFRIHEPVQLIAYAVGEIGESGRYDWAWLRNNDSQERVWEMSWSESRQTGEHSGNRAELAFVSLEPGAYTLGYETDDSHAFDSWRHARPEEPNRWGVTLFALDENVDSTTVEILNYDQVSLTVEEDESAPRPADPPGPPQELPPMPGSTLVTITEVGNEERLEMAFALSEPSRLHISALGEISISGRYDYGWIENAQTGEIVWEMTFQNTVPAGGADRNRQFEGTLELGPGDYVVHYTSDFSHAYGDFGDEPPAHPQGWGIRVSHL